MARLLPHHGLLLAVPLAVLGSPSSPLAQESRPGKVTLRLVLEKGATLRYRTTQHSVRVMSGREMGGNDLIQEYDLEVLGVDPDGTLELLVRMGATKGRLQQGAGRPDLEFDSATASKTGSAPASEGPARDLDIRQKMVALSGRSFRALVTPFGEVKEVRGLAEMLQAAFPQAGGTQGAQLARSYFSEQSIRQSLQELFFQFGRDPVGEGDSWSHDTALPVGVGQYVLAKTRKLCRLAGDAASVSIEGKVKTVEPLRKDDRPPGPGGDQAVVQDALKKTQVEKAEYKAEATLDRASGVVRQQKAEMSILMVMDVSMGKVRVEQRMQLLVERL